MTIILMVTTTTTTTVDDDDDDSHCSKLQVVESCGIRSTKTCNISETVQYRTKVTVTD